MSVAHVLAVFAGVCVSAAVLMSALRTVVLPRGGLTAITRFVFAVIDRIFIRRHGIAARLGWQSYYAPVSLVALPLAWASVVTFGFALIFWGFGVGSFDQAVAISGSSLFTLGYARPTPSGLVLLTFLEALIGLGLVALLISFLPTLYSAFSDREKGVALLRPVLGAPPTAPMLIQRLHDGGALGVPTIWTAGSSWFASIEQSHTSFPSLCSFPPQVDAESWVVTGGTVLDAVALLHACLADDEPQRSAEFTLVLAHGASAFSRVAAAAGLPVTSAHALAAALVDPGPPLEIAVSRAEFDEAAVGMAALGLSLRPDRDESWRRFTLLRGCYEQAVLGLAGLTHAPPAAWTSDRAYVVGRPRFFGSKPLQIHPGAIRSQAQP